MYGNGAATGMMPVIIPRKKKMLPAIHRDPPGVTIPWNRECLKEWCVADLFFAMHLIVKDTALPAE